MTGRAWWLNADDGEPAYEASQLRRIMGGLLVPGVSHRLGAREGVRPNGGPVAGLAGSSWEVHAHQGVIYPGLTSSAGPYIYELEADSGPLAPADGSNPRVDILVVQVEDHDQDASGERRIFADYLTGTPGGSAPATPPGALRLGRIDVPPDGSGSPTFIYEAPWTVASGGILPVRDDSELPASGLYDGMPAWLQDPGLLLVAQGGSWLPQSGWVPIGDGVVSGSGSVIVDLTRDGLFPPGTFQAALFYLDGQFAAGTANLLFAANEDVSSGDHDGLGMLVQRTDTWAEVDSASGSGNHYLVGQWSISPCSAEVLALNIDGGGAGWAMFYGRAHRSSSTESNNRLSKSVGRYPLSGPMTSVRFRAAAGGSATQFDPVRWRAIGLRSEVGS